MKLNKLTQDQINKIEVLLSEGLSSRKVASVVGCGKSAVNNYRNRLNIKPSTNGPKILFLDLESTPSITANFGRYKVNIGPESVIQEGGWLLSASWCWMHDQEVKGIVLTPEEAKNQDDSRIVAELYDLFEQADMVVAHNGSRFDVPLFKTRLIANGFSAPKSVKVIDTLVIAKKLKFNSNKLDSLGNYLGVGRKLPHVGMPLWLGCMQGDKKSLSNMLEYNKQDVKLLVDVYKALRAFDNRAPNAGLYFDDNLTRCVVCGSAEVHETGNVVHTAVSSFAEVQCRSCGHRSRKRKNLNSKDKSSSVLTNTI